MTELLEAVDALTLPVVSRITQAAEADGVETITVATVTHDALLAQLEAAISSTMGGGGGRTMTEKWALNVLDSDALYQFTLIGNTVREWCRMAGLPKPDGPVQGLRAWYVTRLAINDRDDTWHVNVLTGWANAIRGKLNPAKTIELTFACPACGADTWTDSDGATYKHPLRMSYQPQDPDILNTARALCKACANVWEGVTTLRGLRWEADAKATA